MKKIKKDFFVCTICNHYYYKRSGRKLSAAQIEKAEKSLGQGFCSHFACTKCHNKVHMPDRKTRKLLIGLYGPLVQRNC